MHDVICLKRLSLFVKKEFFGVLCFTGDILKCYRMDISFNGPPYNGITYKRESKILFGGGEVIFNYTIGYMVHSRVLSYYFLKKKKKITKWRM